MKCKLGGLAQSISLRLLKEWLFDERLSSPRCCRYNTILDLRTASHRPQSGPGEVAATVLWTSQFGTPGPDAGPFVQNGITAMSTDSSGVYTAGFVGYLASGGSSSYPFVSKYDFTGRQVWTQHFGKPDSGGIAGISVGRNGVYVGGTNGYAFIEELSQSSSLILFGVNPPFSFGLAALLGGLVVTSLLWLRRRWRKKMRPPTIVMRRGSKEAAD